MVGCGEVFAGLDRSPLVSFCGPPLYALGSVRQPYREGILVGGSEHHLVEGRCEGGRAWRKGHEFGIFLEYDDFLGRVDARVGPV
eukprot:13074630-Heterocapsa_arctica.AAC.1